MARKDYFPFFHGYLKQFERLSDEEFGRLIRAALKYSSTGERAELTGIEAFAFDFIAGDIDRAEAAYQEKCTENSRKGKLGGRPKKDPGLEDGNPF